MQINTTVPVLRVFFEENDTRADYRLSRESLNALMSMLHQDQHHGWGQIIKVLVFIFWLACGTSYRVVSRAFSIPKTTVFRSVREVLKSLLQHRGNIIKLPSTEEERKAVSEGFAKLANHKAFLGALGAIDGCHVRIKAPVRDANCYFNRKLFHSVVLQAICNHTSKFIDVFCGYPGSTHNARVLRCSPVYQLAAGTTWTLLVRRRRISMHRQFYQHRDTLPGTSTRPSASQIQQIPFQGKIHN